MRVGEVESLTWADLDEPRQRWRIATSKTGRPRWVSPEGHLPTSHRPRAAWWSSPGAARFRRDHGGSTPDSAHPRRDRCRRADILSPWSAAPPGQPPTSGRRPVGENRRGGRPRRHYDHEPCLYARSSRRAGSRLRDSPRLTSPVRFPPPCPLRSRKAPICRADRIPYAP